MCEDRLLRMDLLFPFFCCGAFGVSFLILASMVDRSVSLILGFAFVVMAATLLSDLTENLVQLAQFRGYIDSGEPSLNEKWIWVASTATKMKLVFFAAALAGFGNVPCCIVGSINRPVKIGRTRDDDASVASRNMRLAIITHVSVV